MDFSPILPPEEDKQKNKIIENKEAVSTDLDNVREPLSITNLVSTTKGHIMSDEKCVAEYDLVTKELHNLIGKMSVKELLDYQKNLLKEREFHTECVFKALNFTIKTEYAKHLLVGSTKDDKNVRNITDRNKINSLANLLKQHNL